MKFNLKALKKKKGLLVVLAVVLLVVVGVVASQQGESLEVEAYQVDRGQVRKTIEETATVETHTERTVNALVTAEVKELRVDVGDTISKGEVIVVFDVEDVEYQMNQLYAQKKSLEAQLADAAHTEPEELAKASAQVRSAQASLNDANRTLDSNTKLYESGAISKDTYEASVNDQIVKSEALVVAEQAYELLKKGLSSDLRKKYLADIEAIAHQIDQLKNTKAKHAIVSPIEGIITEKYMDVGSYLQPGTAIVEIADTENLYLETDVLASDMRSIQVGTPVLINDEDLDIYMEAQVQKVYPKAFSKTSDLGIEQKRVKLELVVERTDRLKLGYEVDIEIIEEQRKEVLRIPDSAAFKINQAWHVFGIQEGKAVLLPVQVGLEGRDYYELLEGIELDQMIIDSPPNELDEGVAVMLKETTGDDTN